MTATIYKTICDQCKKEGYGQDLQLVGWIEVKRHCHIEEDKDFCSLPCLIKWAKGRNEWDKMTDGNI